MTAGLDTFASLSVPSARIASLAGLPAAFGSGYASASAATTYCNHAMRQLPAAVRAIVSTPRARVFVLEQPVWPVPKWIIVVLLLFVGGIFLRFWEPLGYLKIGRRGWMTGWALSHLFGFMLAALLMPDKWFLLFWVGVIWELMEFSFGYVKDVDRGYWYYVWFDIVLNGIGIAVGTSVARTLQTRGADQKRWIALLTVVVTFSAILLLAEDQWKYFKRDLVVARACGCNIACDYDIEAAPRKA
jgi:hypothetical protein